ncbi:hypothetical protein [Marinospirillum perlucidum]|uniref:hypothetical protein n=1 Tax=Marinospirillum perlucidum TaxID=1982602 RepID=UPI000DF26A41|nr:hypothetical protein [Marinospirillum perlucidum]
MEWITALSSAVMALVWVVYFQLFFQQYRRGNRPYLVIHHAQHEQLDALCLLVNMSEEAVHIQCVQLEVYLQSGASRIFTITEYARVNPDDQNLQRILRQGPLQAGGYLVLGSFRNLLLGRKSQHQQASHLLEEIRELEIRTAVIHGPSKHPVGARRRFYLRHDGKQSQIYPQNIHTQQLLRRRDQKKVRQWLEYELKPRNTGSRPSDHSGQGQEISG